MLAGLQPSVELTGGPWFTDNELDTELVDTLKKVVHKHLSDKVSALVVLFLLYQTHAPFLPRFPSLP
jgi:hypothetical protein